jgi:hypothetical protein
MTTHKSSSRRNGARKALAKIDPQSLYVQLGELIATMPTFSNGLEPSKNELQWIARAKTLLKVAGNVLTEVNFTVAANAAVKFGTVLDRSPVAEMYVALHEALYESELSAPVKSQGAFIPAGNVHDALVAIGKVLREATKDALIVDPYLDERVLSDFAGHAAEGVTIRLLADQASHKPTLKPAAERWATQYSTKRPIEVRLAAAKTLHDRLIFVDGKAAYSLTQSIKDFAVKSPASLLRVEPDMATLKVTAYEAVWKTATKLQ